MNKLSFAVLMSFGCISMASAATQAPVQTTQQILTKGSVNYTLTAAQQECFFMKIMAYCPELYLPEFQKTEEIVEEKTVVSRGQKAEAPAPEKTGRAEEEKTGASNQMNPEVIAALECRTVSLMECGVDVGQTAIPTLPQNIREKAVTR